MPIHYDSWWFKQQHLISLYSSIFFIVNFQFVPIKYLIMVKKTQIYHFLKNDLLDLPSPALSFYTYWVDKARVPNFKCSLLLNVKRWLFHKIFWHSEAKISFCTLHDRHRLWIWYWYSLRELLLWPLKFKCMIFHFPVCPGFFTGDTLKLATYVSITNFAAKVIRLRDCNKTRCIICLKRHWPSSHIFPVVLFLGPGHPVRYILAIPPELNY